MTRFHTLIQEVLTEVTGTASPEVELVVQAPVASAGHADEEDALAAGAGPIARPTSDDQRGAGEGYGGRGRRSAWGPAP